MNSAAPSPVRSTLRASAITTYAAVALVVAFFAGSGAVAYRDTQMLRDSSRQVSHSLQIIAGLEDLLSLMKDAETGQRGFVITGDERYLDSYNAALPRIDVRYSELTHLLAESDDQLGRLPIIKAQIATKLTEMANVLRLRRTDGFEAARTRVMTDLGKAAMDSLRAQISVMEEKERTVLEARFTASDAAFRSAVQSGIVTMLVGILLTAAIAWLLRRGAAMRRRQEWLRAGHAGLSENLIGDLGMREVGEKALNFLSEYLGAKAGAIFIGENGEFRRFATYALPPEAALTERFALGDGLIGQAARDGRSFLVQDVPDGYLSIGSALGKYPPRHLLIAPARADGAVNAVIELGFFESVHEASVELLDRGAEVIGIAVRSAQARGRILELLEQTQSQAEELQAQSEELRVSNEELEEQARALQQSQVRLEHQQAELEQTNVQLEEQTQMLESQRDVLAQAKLLMEGQARAVEQASQYKSDFLANMSHELRTPLNSSLILAQLLAENRSGNLTEEQIKYAQTIKNSGNDLLALINDVLDLAKIEAGRMDVKPQRFSVSALLDTLRGQFEPIAQHRGLALHMRSLPGAPEFLETDQQRLEQVLRNLLSNALKFTEHGEVTMEVSSTGADRVAFAVRDTGIGIDAANQRQIFEPFTQAEGTSNRKYGGTGLGLSISREFARLLGGEIQLASEIGRGSVFTVSLPVICAAPAVGPAPGQALPSMETPTFRPRPAQKIVPDDRAHLSKTERVILIVEDDPRYAEILADLAHEQKFQCLVTSSAQEALLLARQHVPNAILLDVGLPDASGLFVLEQLKHDASTRHIPVHVVSGSDYAEKAMELGAIGYMLKPVPRERLMEAFQDLEARLTHRLRRVLVVEDDEVQRGALCKLLASREVEAVGAYNAADCLSQLRGGTFDCMVLDLSLPDASGFSLLEKLNEDDTYAFPPVIIYTGRQLGPDEEQRLRRYSKSIIIKGAKSPERLLDEVALFLHQVVADLPAEQQHMIEKARSREAALEDRRILLAEDDVRNVFALTSLLEPLGVQLTVARNGREAITALESARETKTRFDLVLMDIMMPEMDGFTAMREIRRQPEWRKLPIIALTAKAMPDDQQQCLIAGASDYLAKPLDVEKLLSLIRVWMPR